ncbi:uncharacterized protein LOC121934031 [Sceloporus undulatus]|uniref:uncharacterized protein LOC121934031 n=1 Tax=Sceloporus undulatus TaxID=8520 RepID=UPI001C4CF44E|nr:uncharacterized protein LOC121934031 [Sceloporus undulatus]
MYRAYQPLLPTANRYLQEKWDKASYKKHRRKVELAVPVVNTKSSPIPFHLQVNLKKIQLEKERQALLDRENLLHSAKLCGIKQSKGSVDNWNFYCRHSLNWEKRHQDLARIYWENQQLVKRLEGRKSELAQACWQENWHKEQLIRHSIARYPRGWESCQVKKVRWRQWTESNGSPTSSTGENLSLSPGRTPVLCNTKNKNMLDKSFWGSGSESPPERVVTAPISSTTLVRKKNVVDPSSHLVQRSSKKGLVPVKIAQGGSSSKDANGSSVRAELPEEDSEKEPGMEAVIATTKPHASIYLRKNLRLRPASQDQEKRLEVSSACNAGICYERIERAPKSRNPFYGL